MAYTFVGYDKNSTVDATTTTVQLNGGSAPNDGDYLIVALFLDGHVPTEPTGPTSSGWTLLADNNETSCACYIWGKTISGDAATLVITHALQMTTWSVAKLDNTPTSSSILQEVNGASATNETFTSNNSTADNAVHVCFLTVDRDSVTGGGSDNGWTQDMVASSFSTIHVGAGQAHKSIATSGTADGTNQFLHDFDGFIRIKLSFIEAASGWSAGKVIGVDAANIAKINGVDIANIASVNGV